MEKNDVTNKANNCKNNVAAILAFFFKRKNRIKKNNNNAIWIIWNSNNDL